MTTLLVSLDTRDLEGMDKTLSHIKEGLPKVVKKSINATLKESKTKVVKEVRQVFNVDSNTVAKPIWIKQAANDLYGELFTFGPLADKAIPLTRFDPKPSGPGGKRPAGGASFLIKKNEGRQVIAGSFMAKMPTGHTGVFKRGGQPRLPIYEEYGPSVSDMLTDDDIYPDLQEWTTEAFQNHVRHEVDRLLRNTTK